METIKCVIIDDENNCLEMMEWLLKMYAPTVSISAMCNSAEKGIAAIHAHRPDVVFLDIEMPRMNGFDMLEQFDKLFFDVVFTTAYDKFAIKAFKYSALNYLLKPVDPDDLKETVRRMENKKTVPSKEQIELLFQSVRQMKPTPMRIALTTAEGLIFATTQDIIYCEAESNYTTVVLSGGKKIVVSKVLKDIDEALNGPDFFRVHNSYLINLNRIKKFVRGDGGYVVMDNDMAIGISRSRRQEFMDMFAKF
ncbi:LytTR family DNA-binding domain-containing protein [Dyadobacter chenwenxiniae]|uniref:LytTR family DNA-binding domain-containing protein n=1 Tax=Dyadobacter chenwenxiniae TaxID=2906456 RepID=A0A9X1TJY0_9BACT|nr:LytTR family DNA-binding domain-containing protein [Dyadobacter chenwenxiniae]MCF0060613.1 LytTR family DNA-binding domain-containing protein [Dyadobacter chenwenxiniae]UON80445.1 LytTR family DNA-binding domain-containing protein [Dyadobacter chenwenxiniae]